MPSVGFVGAGRMGAPMVERLLAAGYPVTVHVRRTDVAEDLRRRGARVVERPEAAAESAEIFLSCLFSDVQLAGVGPGVVDALPAGAVFASHTTGAVELVRELADRGAPRGVAVVDAPVSGTAEDIRAGRLTTLLGGDPDAVRRCRDVVAAYSSTVLPTGGPGSALAVKLVNNLLFAAHVQLAASAVRLGEQLGVAPADLFGALQHASGDSSALRRMADETSPEAFGARVGPFLRKDVAACRAAAERLGIRPDLLLDTVALGPFPLVDPEGENP